MVLKFPFVIKDIKSNPQEGKSEKFVQVGPEKQVIKERFRNYADSYYNFKLRPDDLFVTGFPRSGTTLMQEMIWMLINHFDFEKAKSITVGERVPYFEANLVKDYDKEILEAEEQNNKELLKNLKTKRGPLHVLETNPNRRVTKTHLHLNFLPPDLLHEPTRKVIYMARNPKDVMVSWYLLTSKLGSPPNDAPFPLWYKNFKAGLIEHTPYWAHVQQAFEQRHLPNVKILFYEDVVRNLKQTIREVAAFIGVEISIENLNLLEEHLGFDRFKKYIEAEEYLKTISLVDKGQIGSWTKYFPENSETLKDVDEWIAENSKRIGIQYPV